MFAMFSGNESKFNYEVQTQDKHNYTVHPIQTQQSDKKKIKCHEPIANYKHNQMCRSETPIFKIYLLFIASFVCSCAVSLSLFVYTQRNMQLNDSSSSEFITRNEIDEIVQHLLSNVQNSDEVRLYVHSNKNHLEHEQLSPERTSPHGYDDGDVDKRYKAYPYIPPERKLSPMLSKMRERRAANILGENSIADTQQNVQGPSVEFFNPKMRRELEKKDEEIKRSTGKGSAPGGDDWAYLTSYSRIPYEAIAGFCQSTKEYCPPGPPGPPGHGVKGYRGDIGMPGPQGREGPIGPRGPKGTPGSPGLDGRDGIPGEPGLDGIPGRAGADGIPGKDGRDGTPGSNGKNGIDGKDGREGLPGPQGPPGAQGERGLTGPRGRSGKPGLNGTPGQPGITAYKYSTEPGKLLIPPTIAGVPIRPIVVVEDSFLRLRCAASGQPKPDIVWSRLDGRPITDGAWQDSSIREHTLNITHVNRVHNGVYICMAINGVPPAANATFQIEVHFAPLIRVRNQHLYAFEGGSVSLECETEAFPEPLKYWKRRSDNRILDQNDKFRMETITDGYKSSMRLNITDVRPEDFGEYECVSKNEINTTAATFFVYDGSRHPTRTYSEIAVFGTLPPKPISYTEFCPPPNCPQPNCDEHRCNNAYIHQNIEIHQLHFKGLRFPGITNRTFDCVLYAVGKPVYHKSTNITYGSWLKDSRPRTKELSEKIWTTYETDPTTVYEFTDKTSFRNNQATKQRLKLPGFQGNAHVVFNGSFYYHQKDSAVIVRYDLEKRETICNVSLPEFQWNGGHYLYTTMCNYVDLNADENGLWAIYSTPKTSNTYVVKLDAITLEVQYGWNITLNHNKVGEMFIVCGVLYAIDSVTERNTKILLALDLYRGHALNDVNLSFTNPFKNTTMAVYNPETKELFTWDHGNQLTYPIRYNEMTKYDSASERVAEAYIETGYDSQ